MADDVVPAVGANLVYETFGHATINAGGAGLRRSYPSRMVWGDFGTFNAPTLAGGFPVQYDTATKALFGALADAAAADGDVTDKGIIPLLKGALNLLGGTLDASGTFTEAPSPDVKFAVISTAASGVTALVAAVTGKKIRVMNFNLIAAGAVNVTFRTGADAITGAYPLVANSGLAPTGGAYGLFETDVAEALNINLSAAVQVSGVLAYMEI